MQKPMVFVCFCYFTAFRLKTPKMAPRRLLERPKRPQDGAKGPQEGPNMAPRRAQDDPKTAPNRFQVAFQSDFMFKTSEEAPKTSPDPPEDSPRSPKMAPRSPQEGPKRPPRQLIWACWGNVGPTWEINFGPLGVASHPNRAVLRRLGAVPKKPPRDLQPKAAAMCLVSALLSYMFIEAILHRLCNLFPTMSTCASITAFLLGFIRLSNE